MDFKFNKIFTLIVASICAILVWFSDSGHYAIDYYQYWIAAGNLTKTNIYENKNQIALADEYFNLSNQPNSSIKLSYPAKYRKHKIKLSSTPFLYSTIINTGYYDFDLKLHSAISIGSSIVALFLLSLTFKLDFLQTAGMYCIYFILSPLIKSDLLVGNVNQIQLLMFSLFLWLESSKNSTKLAGIVLALSILYKPNIFFILVLVSIYFIKSKQKLINLYFGIAIGTIIGVSYSALNFQSLTPWFDWITNVTKLLSEPPYSLAEGNLSLIQQIKYLFNPLIAKIAFLTIAVISSLAAFKTNDFKLTACLGTLTTILASTLVWPHYLILTVPLIIALMKKSKNINKCLTTLAAACFLILPSNNLIIGIDKIYSFYAGIIGMLVLYFLTITNLVKNIETE